MIVWRQIPYLGIFVYLFVCSCYVIQYDLEHLNLPASDKRYELPRTGVNYLVLFL